MRKYICFFVFILIFLPNTIQSFALDKEINEYSKDSDKDGLSNLEERMIKTNPYNNDTDGDGLLDGFEVMSSCTDPLNKDTDKNKILDGDEDLDNDNLTNLEEQRLKTEPLFEDTDGDNLNDYNEINKYKTNPLLEDSDTDGLLDADELVLGTNPNTKDSNYNNIDDGDEIYDITIKESKFEQSKYVDAYIEGKIKGKLIKDIYIINLEDTHEFIKEDIPGGIGTPFQIKNKTDYIIENISIKFIIEKQILDNNQNNISIYKYNYEEKDLYEIKNEIKYNEESIELSIKDVDISNESQVYMILDKYKYEKYKEKYRYEHMYRGNEEVDKVIILKFANIVYSKLKDEYKGKEVSNIVGYIGDGKYNINPSRDDIDDWTIVNLNDKRKSIKGVFGALAIKKGDILVISYAGTIFPSLGDILADAGIAIGANYQVNIANRFLENSIKQVRGIDKVYVTGHSLGGYLSQQVAYKVLNNELKIDKDIEFKTITFSSPRFFNPKHVEKIAPPNLFKNSKKWKVFGIQDKYVLNIENYFIEKDPVSLSGVKNLGKTYNLEDRIKDDDKDYKLNLDKHNIYNFYKHFETIKQE